MNKSDIEHAFRTGAITDEVIKNTNLIKRIEDMVKEQLRDHILDDELEAAPTYVATILIVEHAKTKTPQYCALIAYTLDKILQNVALKLLKEGK